MQELFWTVSRREALAGLVCALGIRKGLAAQQNTPTFSTDVKVVSVFATVRNKQGKLVNDLTKSDFSVEEDGRPQTIRYFSRQTDLPLTIGLLVDTSRSERRMLGEEREASQTFLEQVLRPSEDKAFLIHFGSEVELLQDVTSSRRDLEKALALLNRPEWSHNTQGSDSNSQDGGGNRGSWGGQGGGGRRQGGLGGTALYDAIYLAAHDVMKTQKGRKAFILLTDGEDNASKVSLEEAIHTTEQADTLAYSVRIADEQTQSPFGGPGMERRGGWGGGGGGWGGRPGNRQIRGWPDGKKVLQQISRETGGGYFEVSKKKTVAEIYQEIQEELRNQYSIGYTPERRSGDGGEFRAIEVSVKGKGLTVQARKGYYAGGS